MRDGRKQPGSGGRSRTIRLVLPAKPRGRDRDDRCPGVVWLIVAADGRLARVRLPGGFVTPAGLRVLAAAAVELGDGRLELTSRGNVQVRGLAPDAGTELAERLHAAGLWPSQSHELVRNIVASPLAGIDAGPDLSGLVRELDRQLCADPRLAELSGRFLFAIDDGRGDADGLGADVVAVVGVDRAWVEGAATSVAEVPALMLRCATAFLDERAAQQSRAWRVDELSEGRARMRARLGVAASRPEPPPLGDSGRTPIGPIRQADGGAALVVAPRLGRLTQEQAVWVADQLSGRPARITPWRSVVLPDLADVDAVAAAAAAVGLEGRADSPWSLVSACAGRPRCASALADVQQDAGAAVERWPGRRVHWSGCERRCGRPVTTEIDVVATAEGYRVHGAERSTVDA
jgi:precorrin-3B synthase